MKAQYHLVEKNKYTEPIVSILMSVLNGENYIREAIESILSQAYENFELLIIDDGSTDSSWSIISEFSRIDSRLKPIHFAVNQGTSKALNAGLAKAKGIYITRQDCDDISLPNRIEAQIEILENLSDLGGVGVAAVMVQADGTPIKNDFTITDPAIIQKKLIDYMCLCGPTVMVKRKIFEQAGYYFADDLSYTEDYDLCLRISEISNLGNIKTPLYLYRQHDESVSRKYRFRQLYNKAIALERSFYRRNPGSDLNGYAQQIGRDYLRAAIVGIINGEPGASECREKVQAYNPGLLSNVKEIEEIITRYSKLEDTDRALILIQDIFSQLLPKNTRFNMLKSRLIGKIHMREVFNGLAQKSPELVDAHLWLGIKADPGWLFNRGVLALVLDRIFLRRLTSRSY